MWLLLNVLGSSLCSALFLTCKHLNSHLISKRCGRVEKKGSDDVNTGNGERRRNSRFSLFHCLSAVFHHLLSSLWQQFVRTKADYCDPTRSIPFILPGSLARMYKSSISQNSSFALILFNTCHCGHLRLCLSTGNFDWIPHCVGKLAWQRSDVTRVYREPNSEY